MNAPTFLLCTNPALPPESGGVFVLYTKCPRCLVRVHTFNTYEERDEWMKQPPRIGGLSLKMPVAYECIYLFDGPNGDELAGLMRRIADWHYAITKIK